MTAILFVAAPLLTVISLVLVLLGRRGRRADDHPLCRRCGFDLVGKPAESTRCSECGADLNGRNAVRIGNRARRPRVQAIGVAMLAASLLISAVVIINAKEMVDWESKKPTWLLLYQVRGNAELATPARDELFGRLSAGTVSDHHRRTAIELALSLQANREAFWDPRWGDIVERLHEEKKLTRPQWEQYLKQSVRFSSRARQQVRRGDPLPIEMRLLPVRLGLSNKLRLLVGKDSDTVTVDGKPLLSAGGGTEFAARSSDGGFTFRSVAGDTIGRKGFALDKSVEQDGMHTVAFPCSLHFHCTDESGEPPVKFELPMTAQFELLPETRPTVRLIDDSKHAVAFTNALSVDGVVVRRNAKRWSLEPRLRVQGPLPVDMAFDLVLRARGREWQLHDHVIVKTNPSFPSFSIEVDDFPPDLAECDLILRMDSAVAAETLDVVEIWKHDIVLEKVPIRWEKPAH